MFRRESKVYYRNRRKLSKGPAMSVLRCINAACLATALALPAVAADIDKVCAERACRAGGFEAVVGVDAERFITIPVSHSPYLLEDGSILLFPGETVAVQFAIDGGDIAKPVAATRYAPHLPALIVKEGGAPQANPDDAGLPPVTAPLPADEVALLPPNTVLLSYGQLKPKGESGMALVVEHNLARTLKYSAMIFVVQTGGGYRQSQTSSCPVMPKMWGHETWPDRLGAIVLGNFHFPADSTVMTCE